MRGSVAFSGGTLHWVVWAVSDWEAREAVGRLAECLQGVLGRIPADDIARWRVRQLDLALRDAPLDDCPTAWATTWESGMVRLAPLTRNLDDATLVALLAYELAHLTIFYRDGGRMSDRPAALAVARAWGFDVGPLEREVERRTHRSTGEPRGV